MSMTVKACPAITGSGTTGVRRVSGACVDATAPATVEFRDGGAAGPIVGYARLTAAGSKYAYFGGVLLTAGALYVNITDGSPTVVVYEA